MAVVELKMPIDKYADGAVKYLSENAKTFDDIRIAVAGLEAIKRKSSKEDKWFAEVSRLLKDADFKGPGGARDAASKIVTINRLGGAIADARPIDKLLKAGQRKDGGWGKEDSKDASDLESTYRVMRCFMLLKTRPDNVDALRSFIAKCRNEDGGFGLAPGQPSTVNSTYFAAIVTHWLKQ
jgi:hypothetical protein